MIFSLDKVATRHKQLPKDEEKYLVIAAQCGDFVAREIVIKHNLSWVISTAKSYKIIPPTTIDDLIAEGTIGMMKALEKFDPEVGTRFSTYALWWIRAYIGKLVHNHQSIVSRANAPVVQDFYLDNPVGEGEITHLENVLDNEQLADVRLTELDHNLWLNQVLARLRFSLGTVGWDIVQSRLLRHPDDAQTLQEISLRHGVSRERIRQIEISVKQKIKHYLDQLGEEEAKVLNAPAPEPEVKMELNMVPVKKKISKPKPMKSLSKQYSRQLPEVLAKNTNEALNKALDECYGQGRVSLVFQPCITHEQIQSNTDEKLIAQLRQYSSF